MSTNELLAYITERVEHYSKFYELSTGKAFMLWYAVEALRLSQEDAFEAVGYDGGNDHSIDLFYIDEEFERVVIAQGKFRKNGKYSPTPGELLELVHTSDWLSSPEALRREGREDLAAAAEDYLAAVSRGFSVEYALVYMGPPKREVIDTAAHFNSSESGNIPARTARVVPLDLLQHVHDEYIDKTTRIDQEVLSIPLEKSFEQSGVYGKALVVSVPGIELHRLYEAHGDALFDRNVRLFLGARKGGVNAGMKETLDSSGERRNFWAYNNGMTFVCDRFDIDEDAGEVTLHNFSVVNGCQTTVSISNTPVDSLDGVEVLARVIASTEEGVVDSIIEYTNRQTPIQPWDLNSQNKLQKRLKKELAKDPHPFFYVLRRGETSKLQAAEKAKFTRGGKLQAIPHDVLSQLMGAFDGTPVIAYKDKSKLFSTHRDAIFPEDIRAEKLMLVWLAGDAATNAVSSAIQEAVADSDPETVRILKQGGKLFVLSVRGLLLKERNGPNYLARLKREVAGSNTTKQRLAGYATLAVIWYIEAVKEATRGGETLSQLVRSHETFVVVREKIRTKWKVQALQKDWVEAVLPKL